MAEFDEAARDLLERPLPVVISTLNRSGAPHSVPAWFRLDGERVTIWGDRSRAWVRHLQRDPRIALVVAEPEPPFAAVIVRGTASLSHGREVVLAEARRICARYIDPDELDAYVEQWAHLDTLVTVEPETVRSWGRGY